MDFVMSKEDLRVYDTPNLASIINQFNFAILAQRVSNTSMTGEVFLNILPNMAQFVFSDSIERFQFDEFMKLLTTKIIRPTKDASSTALDTSFSLFQDSLLINNNQNLFINDAFNLTNNSLANDQSIIVSINNN